MLEIRKGTATKNYENTFFREFAENLKKIEPEYILKRGMVGEEENNADAQDAPSGDAAEAS